MTFRNLGKTAVVIGGSTGIGLALAKALARERMDIVLAARTPATLESAAAAVREIGARVLAVRCDAADRAQVAELARRAREAFGPVDLLCANAGVTTVGRLVDHTDADWDWSLDINLRGTTNAIRAFYPDMAARRSGAILLTGSQTALAPDWVLNHGPYIGAKAAVHALATSLRAEAAGLGVSVSLLIPAATDTAIAETARRVPDPEGALLPNPAAPPPLADFPFTLSPDEVAERALAGLKRDAPIIATHAAMKPLVEDYFARILAAYDDAAAF